MHTWQPNEGESHFRLTDVIIKEYSHSYDFTAERAHKNLFILVGLTYV